VERGLARHTLDAYGRDLARLIWLPRRTWASDDDITPSDVVDFLLGRRGRARAAQPERTLVAVRGFCKHLVGERGRCRPVRARDSPAARAAPGVPATSIVQLIAQPRTLRGAGDVTIDRMPRLRVSELVSIRSPSQLKGGLVRASPARQRPGSFRSPGGA
jgi:site-specific recombinase XerC